MDIQDIQKYRSPTGSSNNSESNVTPKTELKRAKQEQLALGASDSESDASDSEEDSEDPEEDDLAASASDKSERDEGTLERIIKRTSQLIEEGQEAMAPNPEPGSSKGKETAELSIEEQLRQWEAHTASLQHQLDDKTIEVQTL